MMKYDVKKIKKFQTHDWLLHKHYAKRIPSISYAFGLFDMNNVNVGICTIGKPASPSLCIGICGETESQYVYELNRLCVNDNLPKNVLSYFVSRCLKMLPSLILVSYADKAMGHHGYIYQATNWIYTGDTKERTDIGSDDGSHQRHYSKDIDYKANRKYRSSKHRYVYFTGSKLQRKKWKKMLKYHVKKYPKGENCRYDASYSINPQINLL